jgi:glycerophosphoryl diester phosphodiesterase
MEKVKRKLIVLLVGWVANAVIPATAYSQKVFLEQGYAHNDYLHKKPLFDALNNGFTHIEADVFLRKDSLIIAHWFPYLKEKRTLESLYLAPLKKYIQDTDLDTNTDQPSITLVIDIKSSPRKTYLALKSLLEKYSDILSCYENGVFKQGRVNIVITGRKPVDLIMNETRRLVMMDDFLDHISYSDNNKLFAMASCKYSRILKWTGKGPIPVDERNKLQALVDQAHSQGKKARLWASPENEKVWDELLNCGIDFINTDALSKLKAFYWSKYIYPDHLVEVNNKPVNN